MFHKILIANRGEIAVRVIRACRELGIETVAIYSKADEDSLHTQLADQAVCIGEAASAESYLNMERILSAAIATGAEAIHPGFGFLSENAKFAQKCEQCNIEFIGPSAEIIRRMGNKQEARQTMMKAKVPVVPGTKEAVFTSMAGLDLAKKIGFPVMIKAASGGGGKGMRVSYSAKDFEKNFELAQKESQNNFADDTMYIEKFIENPRHIEIQILADKYGNVLTLGERDCSIQRRHQKMIEESPSAALDDSLRKKMSEAAAKAAKATGYYSAGTIEFLLDKHKNFYFMEMNTRIQVEHGVTEMVTGLDLIKEQIFIAAGEKLAWKQKDIHLTGHSIECRINAENPDKNFMPNPGKVTSLYLPGGHGVRIDSAIYAGYTIPPYYDSMIAKVIVHAKDRASAIDKMRSALGEVNVEGVITNLDYQYDIVTHPKFIEGDFDTGFIEKYMS